jgi:predicted aspartyl protease
MRAVLPIWYLRGMLAGLALPVSADPPPDPSAEVSVFALPTRIDQIGRVLAPVKINGKGPFKFIVDTGASHSTISPRLAAALGLDPAEEVRMRVNGITGTADVPSVTVHKLEAGDLVIEETRLPVVWAPLMAGADGILGVAALKQESIFVDFRRNRVTISRSRAAGTPAGFSRVAGQRLEGGLLTVTAHIGGIRVQAIIDTGSERTIGNIALRDALKGWRRGAPLREVTQVYGATIDVAAGEMEVAPTIDLGSVRITDVIVVYGDFHIFEVWGMRSRPAVIIGMDVLGTVNALGIDFRRSELYLEGVQYSGALRRPPPALLGSGRTPGVTVRGV